MDKQVLFNILSYIESLKSEANSDDIDTAISLLESSFDISLSSANDFKEYSYYPLSITNLLSSGAPYNNRLSVAEKNPKFKSFVETVSQSKYYEGAEQDSVEYLQRHAKLIEKFNERMNTSKATQDEESSSNNEALAEEKKIQGNTAVSSKDFEAAIQYYTEALDLSPNGPNSHVYYCNRAAAYCHLNEYKDAIADCEASIKLQSDYVKAYSRLGLAYFFVNNYESSVKAYERASELEPDNESTKKSLKQAKKKFDESKRASSSSSSGSSNKSMTGTSPGGSSSGLGAGGLPDMSSMLNDPSLLNNPFMKDAMSKLGGQEGVANLMKDPNMMAMAQKMMQDPAALQQAMSMLGGGGAGGMPDMSSLLGGAGAGSKKKGGAFKGFEDSS